MKVPAVPGGPALSDGVVAPRAVHDENGVLIRKEAPLALEYVPDEILIKFNAQASAAVREKLNGELRISGPKI
jgi:hypothetical protein